MSGMTVQEAIDAKKLNPDTPWGVSGMTYKEAIDRYGKEVVGDRPWVAEDAPRVKPVDGSVVGQLQGVAALAALKRILRLAQLRAGALTEVGGAELAWAEADTFAQIIADELNNLTPKDDA